MGSKKRNIPSGTSANSLKDYMSFFKRHPELEWRLDTLLWSINERLKDSTAGVTLERLPQTFFYNLNSIMEDVYRSDTED